MSSFRLDVERTYWDKAALDPDVDEKYICEARYGEECREIVRAPVKYKPAARALEIGSGVGRLLSHMGPYAYGVDISANMNAIARERHNLNVVTTDGRTLPFDDGAIDYVYSVALFQHIPNDAVESYLYETERVLGEGGLFLFQFIEGDEREAFSIHRSLGWMVDALGRANLTVGGFFKAVHHQWTWIYGRSD